MRRVFLSGEGVTELGDWWKERPYRSADPKPGDRGVLEALLQRCVGSTAFTVVDGVRWTKSPLYRAGVHRSPETRRILGLCTRADEARCDVLVFSRDRDGDDEREADVEAGIREAQSLGYQMAIIGGVAIEEIEAWLLALTQERGSEGFSDPKAKLAALGRCVGSAERLAVVDDAELSRIPNDALSLLRWLTRAQEVFGM